MAGFYAMLACGASIAYAQNFDSVGTDAIEVRPTVIAGVPRFYEKVYARVLEAALGRPALLKALFFWGLERGRTAARAHYAWRRPTPLVALQAWIADRLVFAAVRGRLGGRLRFCVSGSAPLSIGVMEFFYAIGIPIVEGYGLTETSPVITVNRVTRNRPGTVGPPIANVVIKIADDGEILVQGPGVMKGYHNLPAETAAALEGGWFHTGDIGRLDADGFLVITDRKKDLLVTAGGKKVAPQPIENALKTLPWVAEAVLIGDGRPYVTALVVPNFAQLEVYARAHGIAFVTQADLVHHPAIHTLFERAIAETTAGLARFEQIKRFTLLEREFRQDDGDLTPTLKVRRRIISEKFAPMIEAMYAGHETPQLEGWEPRDH
jgi:long-chain acyl-CoA synthetase